MSELTENTFGQEQAVRRFLHNYSEKPKDDQTILGILTELGCYYDADRSYIFELNNDRSYANSICEWCRDGVYAEIPKPQNIPLAEFECWFNEFEEKGEFFVSSRDEDWGADSGIYRIPASRGADSLIQALAIPYENIYAVNADTCEAVCYRMGQTMNDRYGQKFAAGNYELNIRSYIENDVLKEDRQLFDRVRTVHGVNALLADKKTYYFNYRVFRNDLVQYFQCQLAKPSRKRNEFVIAFKNVDEEKKQEFTQQRKV